MLDRLTSMSVFICAADNRSFTAAAEVFGISATMVGKHVRFLEERVGAKLLNRTTRQQSLTEIGRIYYERSQAARGRCDRPRSPVSTKCALAPRGLLKIPRSGVVRQSAPGRRRSPPICVGIRRWKSISRFTIGPWIWWKRGFEAAIRIGPLADSGLMARALKPYRMWLCAAPRYLSETGTPKTAQDLARHNCLGFAYWQRKRTCGDCANPNGPKAVEVKGRLTVNNGQALRTAAIEGLGIIMQPEVLVGDDVAAGRLVRLLPDYDLSIAPDFLISVYLADRRPTPKLRRFHRLRLSNASGNRFQRRIPPRAAFF